MGRLLRDLLQGVPLVLGLVVVGAISGYGILWLTRLRPLARRTERWRAMAATIGAEVDPQTSRWLTPAMRGVRDGVAFEAVMTPRGKGHVSTVVSVTLDAPLGVGFLVETFVVELASSARRGQLVRLGKPSIDERARVRAADPGALHAFVARGAGDVIGRFLETMPASWEASIDDTRVDLVTPGGVSDPAFLRAAIDEAVRLARELSRIRRAT